MDFPLDRQTSAGVLSIRCRLFARYAELTGLSDFTLELPSPSTVADAVRRLREQVPSGDRLPERPLAAVNLEHALPSTELHEGDELALLPPIAGGVP